MTPSSVITFQAPVTLRLTLPASRSSARQSSPVERTFSALSFHVQVDPMRRELRASLPPIPGSILLYGPDDYAAAAPDTMDDHAERILQLLGTDPASTLQALIDGTPLPSPSPRVPREIPNWRAKAILAAMGKLDAVDAMIAAMPDPDATIMRLAWSGNAALARRSQTVQSLGKSLGLSSSDLDAFFIAADSINL